MLNNIFFLILQLMLNLSEDEFSVRNKLAQKLEQTRAIMNGMNI